MKNFKYWNNYLIIGIILLIANKFINKPEILGWLVLIIGLGLSVYGLTLFFRDKRSDES
ncbi:hypothetical protein [Seonamhaeicola aphaedonensis]|uniref:Uncharacterized protein n=1 Tax=Seonamhaeicola aphaedonensis TaxID=1461338 RepID=A0A3D9H818_9FLAO|nr:hypothetical protein [Seonamhaeicola aphaedonensis]RED45632.1 hypothetical protein DFQ02_10810 [Seonamhaeicola aphaedonensis]